MKKEKIILLISIVLVLLLSFIGFKLVYFDNLPKTATVIYAVDTNDNSKIEIDGADSEKILKKFAKGKKNYFDVPSCAGSNIELEFHTKSKTYYRQICGDDCGTYWDKKGNSYYISDQDMKEIKDILSNYNVETSPQ